MDVSPFFLLIVLHFNSHSFELCPGPDGDSVCCFGYVWSLKQRKCIPCMIGYTGVNCTTPCPVSYYGQNCISTCDCSFEHCHHVHGCRVIPSSTEEVHVQLSLSTSNELTKNIYSGKCPERRRQKRFLASATSVICACLITTSASFLIVYIGLHRYMISHKSTQMTSSIVFV
ncbi:uncharacterized protein LOC111102948 isoform X1 [Crassostrea virginica]